MFFNLDIVNSDQLLNIMDAQIQFVEFVEVEANVCSCTDEIKKIEEEIQAHTIQHERLNKEYYENLYPTTETKKKQTQKPIQRFSRGLFTICYQRA